MSAIKLTESMIRSFVEGFDTVLFDCDGILVYKYFISNYVIRFNNISFINFKLIGVLWMGGWMGVVGAKIIGRAAELVNYLKDNGKQVSTWFNIQTFCSNIFLLILYYFIKGVLCNEQQH